ncbi:MAG: hypothetical protein WC554_07710 [Clostridia bacterium]
MAHYRAATAMFIKEYVGAYYRDEYGLTGEEPLNLMFHNIKTMVPNLVMQNPVNKVTTPILAHRQYAELLSLGLNFIDEQLKLKKIIRAWVVNALFGWGILKVGLAAKGQMLQFGDANIDPGMLYCSIISLDDFVIDPICKSVDTSLFQGHRTMAPRQILLDTEGYNHDVVKQLPSSSTDIRADRISDLTKRYASVQEILEMQDYVDVVELWMPEIDAIVTIPDPYQTTIDKYVGLMDYEGPKEGPYIHLSFTPPVPNNPFPVAPVGIWFDLHKMANRTLSKIMDQSDRQRDILMYNPSQADEAQEILDAEDGDARATSDPNGVKVVSFGGQNQNNEVMLQHLQVWYNYMSGNPDLISGGMSPGTKGTSETATRSQILQANAGIGVEDARQILYDQTAEVNKKFAWYLHTDPFIELPLPKRTTGNEYQQVFLTPEQRQGDFLEYTFDIVQRSMSKVDPMIRLRNIREFCINVLPSAVQAAQLMMSMGRPFNLEGYLTTVAEEMGIGDWIGGMFDDPDFLTRLQIMSAMGPQNAGKAGSMAGFMQNQGNPMQRNVPGEQEQANMMSQETAAEAQSQNEGVY